MRIAIIGAGPSGLFVYKTMLEEGDTSWEIDIFEKNDQLGAGMPYSIHGANLEHITNVSGNEIPKLGKSLQEWISKLNNEKLAKYNLGSANFNEYKVVPRLLFGEYLQDEFKCLIKLSKDQGIKSQIFYNHIVDDIAHNPNDQTISVYANNKVFLYDYVVICTGHHWPEEDETLPKGYFNSPYPPSKLSYQTNYPVAIKGASLTAIDATRTLARRNGSFEKVDGKTIYKVDDDCQDFKIFMHSRSGLLPAIRFHLEDPYLGRSQTLSPTDIKNHREQNDGFLSLDYIFEYNFKQPLREKDPELYERISDMNVEQFVEMIMSKRESIKPFDLFKAEYTEALTSIKRKQSIHWKELLAVLSYTMNYPAKYFSAEDMLRLQKVLMPLISLVIAFVPQSSVEELIALYEAGVLELIGVGDDSRIENHETEGITYHYTDDTGKKTSVYYKLFIDCTGQPHLNIEDIPYSGLVSTNVISSAKVRFRSSQEAEKQLQNGNILINKNDNNYYLKVPGIAVNDYFQAVDAYGAYNERVYVMAVPFIGGYNPDYSGLDFCETASRAVVSGIKKSF
jgi:hypothetical protein